MELKNFVIIALCIELFFHLHVGQLLNFMFSGLILRGIQLNENNECQNRIREAEEEIGRNLQNALQNANLEAQKELKVCQDNITVAVNNAVKSCEKAVADSVSAALLMQNVTAQAALNECNANCNKTVEDAVSAAILSTNDTVQMKLENCLSNACFINTVQCRKCIILSQAECTPETTCSLTSENLCSS